MDFLTLWRAFGYTERQPVAEYQFAWPRRWRFDFAFVAERVAVEMDGGQWVANGGRHNRDSDRDKLNQAAALGWRVLRFSNQQWADDPHGCIALTKKALEAA
jgi:very-short-patch-repair endonuclease